MVRLPLLLILDALLFCFYAIAAWMGWEVDPKDATIFILVLYILVLANSVVLAVRPSISLSLFASGMSYFASFCWATMMGMLAVVTMEDLGGWSFLKFGWLLVVVGTLCHVVDFFIVTYAGTQARAREIDNSPANES